MAKKGFAKKGVAGHVVARKIDDSEIVITREIRAALIAMNDFSAPNRDVATYLVKKFPGSAKVTRATSASAWSVYVSNERRKAAKEMGQEYIGRGKSEARKLSAKSKPRDSSNRASEFPSNEELYNFFIDCEQAGVEPEMIAALVPVIQKTGSAERAQSMAARLHTLRSQIDPAQVKAVLKTMAGK
jgi:hypothetical protein